MDKETIEIIVFPININIFLAKNAFQLSHSC